MPAVAPSSTGLFLQTSTSTASKKVLNRPEGPTLNTGVTAMTASAARTDSITMDNRSSGKRVSRASVMAWAYSRSSTVVTSTSAPSRPRAVAAARESWSVSMRVELGVESPADRATRRTVSVMG